MKRDFQLDLYLVTDRGLTRDRPLIDIVEAAVQGGVTMVQLREKKCSTREFINLAHQIKKILKTHRIPLIINDRLDIALAVDADGVHIGQSDMPYEITRRILGPEKIIGLSVESLHDAEQAETRDVDYLGVSPIYFTPTKTDLKQELGLEGLRTIAAFSRHRLVGIGGLNAANVTEVIRAGAEGAAVVSAICSADDPLQSTRNLLHIIQAAKSGSVS